MDRKGFNRADKIRVAKRFLELIEPSKTNIWPETASSEDRRLLNLYEFMKSGRYGIVIHDETTHLSTIARNSNWKMIEISRELTRSRNSKVFEWSTPEIF